MKSISRFAIWLLLVVVLAACTLEIPPPISASVERYSKGMPVQTWTLTESQLRSLSEWFSQHKSGWSPSYVTYVPNVAITVVHAGGKQSSINIWSSKKVVVNSGGSQVEQEFEASVVQTLLAIVEVHGG